MRCSPTPVSKRYQHTAAAGKLPLQLLPGCAASATACCRGDCTMAMPALLPAGWPPSAWPLGGSCRLAASSCAPGASVGCTSKEGTVPGQGTPERYARLCSVDFNMSPLWSGCILVRVTVQLPPARPLAVNALCSLQKPVRGCSLEQQCCSHSALQRLGELHIVLMEHRSKQNPSPPRRHEHHQQTEVIDILLGV